MKLFDGSPSRGAKGEPERTSAWQPRRMSKKRKKAWWEGGKGKRNGQTGWRVSDGCDDTERQTDSGVNAQPEAAVQYHGGWGSRRWP